MRAAGTGVGIGGGVGEGVGVIVTVGVALVDGVEVGPFRGRLLLILHPRARMPIKAIMINAGIMVFMKRTITEARGGVNPRNGFENYHPLTKQRLRVKLSYAQS